MNDFERMGGGHIIHMISRMKESMDIDTYIHTYVCMYVFMYVYICNNLCICMYVYIYIWNGSQIHKTMSL